MRRCTLKNILRRVSFVVSLASTATVQTDMMVPDRPVGVGIAEIEKTPVLQTVGESQVMSTDNKTTEEVEETKYIPTARLERVNKVHYVC